MRSLVAEIPDRLTAEHRKRNFGFYDQGEGLCSSDSAIVCCEAM